MHRPFLVLILRLAGAALAVKPGIQVAAAQARPYSGPRSGTLACSGGPIPQNGEYVFRDLPPVHLQLEYNKKIWEGKLEPGNGQTQRLILKNVGNGPQKKCLVHWTAIQ
jgi:hypothetical protein